MGKGLETHQQFYDSENRESTHRPIIASKNFNDWEKHPLAVKTNLKKQSTTIKNNLFICPPDDSSDGRVYFESEKPLFNIFMRERNAIENSQQIVGDFGFLYNENKSTQYPLDVKHTSAVANKIENFESNAMGYKLYKDKTKKRRFNL